MEASRLKRPRKQKKSLHRAPLQSFSLPSKCNVKDVEFSEAVLTETPAAQTETGRPCWADASDDPPEPKVHSTTTGKDLESVTSIAAKKAVMEVATATDEEDGPAELSSDAANVASPSGASGICTQCLHEYWMQT